MIHPFRCGTLGSLTRRPVILCQVLLGFSAVVGTFLLIFILIDWSVTNLDEMNLQPTIGESHDESRTDFSDPSLSYGIVIDCGSSGSRVFVYCWPPHSGEPSRLLKIRLARDSKSDPVIMKVEPGLLRHDDCTHTRL